MDLATVSAATRTNRAGTGSASVTVHGQGFGHAAYSGAVRLGGTACEDTAWESTTAVRCRTSEGTRGTQRVAVTVGERAGTATEAWSVDLATVSAATRTNRAGTGSASVTVQGSNLGLADYTSAGRLGGTGCESTEWWSETSVRCRTTDGARSTRRLVMTAGERAGTATDAFSFDRPVISLVSRINHVTTGSVSLTLHGSSFWSLSDASLRARVESTACESSVWKSTTTMMCRASSGVGGTRRVFVTVGQSIGSLTEAFSYCVPQISILSSQNCPAQGNCVVQIYGSGFGQTDFSTRARIGRTACIATPWTSESAIMCKIPRGTGVYSSVQVTAAVRPMSTSWAFSFDAPYIAPSTIRFADGGGTQVSSREITLNSTEARVTASFQGKNFGPYYRDMVVMFGHPAVQFPGGFDAYICEVEGRSNDSFIECTVPAGIGRHHRFKVLVDRQTAIGTDVLNYPPPILAGGTLRVLGLTDAAEDVTGSTTAGGVDVIELTGLNFGPYAVDVDISFGPLPSASQYLCAVLPNTRGESSNHTTLQCAVPSGVGKSHVFNVTVGRQNAIGTATFSFPPPRLDTAALEVLGVSGPAKSAVGSTTVGGVDVLRLSGANFGPNPTEVSVTYGHPPDYGDYTCATVAVRGGKTAGGQTVLECFTAAGVGHSLRLRIKVGGQAVVSNDTFSYPAPTLLPGSLRILGSRCTAPDRCYSLTQFPNGLKKLILRSTVGDVDAIEVPAPLPHCTLPIASARDLKPLPEPNVRTELPQKN